MKGEKWEQNEDLRMALKQVRMSVMVLKEKTMKGSFETLSNSFSLLLSFLLQAVIPPLSSPSPSSLFLSSKQVWQVLEEFSVTLFSFLDWIQLNLNTSHPSSSSSHKQLSCCVQVCFRMFQLCSSLLSNSSLRWSPHVKKLCKKVLLSNVRIWRRICEKMKTESVMETAEMKSVIQRQLEIEEQGRLKERGVYQDLIERVKGKREKEEREE